MDDLHVEVLRAAARAHVEPERLLAAALGREEALDERDVGLDRVTPTGEAVGAIRGMRVDDLEARGVGGQRGVREVVARALVAAPGVRQRVGRGGGRGGRRDVDAAEIVARVRVREQRPPLRVVRGGGGRRDEADCEGEQDERISPRSSAVDEFLSAVDLWSAALRGSRRGRSDARPGGAAGMQALRAVAVALVLIFHLWPSAVRGGFVGVDVFFVISGFLITAHLLREVDRDRALLAAGVLGAPGAPPPARGAPRAARSARVGDARLLVPDGPLGAVLRPRSARARCTSRTGTLAARRVDYFAPPTSAPSPVRSTSGRSRPRSSSTSSGRC